MAYHPSCAFCDVFCAHLEIAGKPSEPRNPSLVCRVLLKHGRVCDALDLALAGLERVASAGSLWLSPGLIDQIDAAARAADVDRSEAGGAMQLRLLRLEDAVRAWLAVGPARMHVQLQTL
jgi:hypothetical protein